MVKIEQATEQDAALVGTLVYRLICELGYTKPDAEGMNQYTRNAADLLHDDGPVWAFLALGEHEQALGVLTLHECAALYAGGRFGEISELYIDPNHRSDGIAPKLIEAGVAFGKTKGWPRLEVGAPDQPTWKRTFDFYIRQGFEEVGPRLRLMFA